MRARCPRGVLRSCAYGLHLRVVRSRVRDARERPPAPLVLLPACSPMSIAPTSRASCPVRRRPAVMGSCACVPRSCVQLHCIEPERPPAPPSALALASRHTEFVSKAPPGGRTHFAPRGDCGTVAATYPTAPDCQAGRVGRRTGAAGSRQPESGRGLGWATAERQPNDVRTATVRTIDGTLTIDPEKGFVAADRVSRGTTRAPAPATRAAAATAPSP